LSLAAEPRFHTAVLGPAYRGLLSEPWIGPVSQRAFDASVVETADEEHAEREQSGQCRWSALNPAMGGSCLKLPPHLGQSTDLSQGAESASIPSEGNVEHGQPLITCALQAGADWVVS
jgi:hypothetical protein